MKLKRREVDSFSLSIKDPNKAKAELKHTTDATQIAKAVASQDESVYRHLVWNPNLTEDDCRYILPFLTHPLDKVFLINREVFPADLLYELALTEDPEYIGNYIMVHKNSSREAKVVLALRRSGNG